jgi:hypothetical protein
LILIIFRLSPFSFLEGVFFVVFTGYNLCFDCITIE